MNKNTEPLRSIPILEIAERLGISVRRNKATCFKGHDKKTPSLSFTPHKNLWHCFGCGAGGDGIKLVMEYFEYDFKQACEWLRNGRSENTSFVQNHPTVFPAKETVEQRADQEVYSWLLETSTLSPEGMEYLMKRRGYRQETIEHFNIKDLKHPADKHAEAVKRWGKERLFRAGLTNDISAARSQFVWWDHVILFPFVDIQNNVRYIQARRIEGNEPRYVNLKGVKTEIFNLKILQSLKPGEVVFITEGITDTLSAYEVGLNSVGILGANGFKKEWVTLFVNFNICLVPDADSAGQKFSEKLEETFRDVGKAVQIIRLPAGMDLTDVLKGALK